MTINTLSLDDLDKLVETKTSELRSETLRLIIEQQNMTDNEITNHNLITLQKELNDLENELKIQNNQKFSVQTEFQEFEEQMNSH